MSEEASQMRYGVVVAIALAACVGFVLGGASVAAIAIWFRMQAAQAMTAPAAPTYVAPAVSEDGTTQYAPLVRPQVIFPGDPNGPQPTQQSP
jgi:hypothetical protein